MWEIRDAEKVASIDILKRASDSEINKIRTELVNMNAIYFMGCRKLIREKQKMDWRERNPNTIGRKKKKRKSILSGREGRVSSKIRNVNDVLKDSNDITEAEMKKKSDKTEKKRKAYMRDTQEKKK